MESPTSGRPRAPGIVVVDLQPAGRRAAVAQGTTILAAAQSVGVELQAICGGAGTCAGCRVRLAHGALSDPTPEEHRELSSGEIVAGLRMACQATALGDVRVDIPPESLTAAQRVQLEGGEEPIPAGPSRLSRLGLAIDIGTTKLAVYLLDLDSGRTLARAGAMNPQIAYGEDLISRIAYTDQNPAGGRVLREKLVDRLNRLIGEICAQVGASRDRIVDVVAVGNTVMHHLFAGLAVRTLGTAPYRPLTTDALDLSARDAGLDLSAGTRVFVPSNIAGYVGADHVAALLSTGVGETNRTALALDIGTNTEISLARGGRLFSCSSPSGPAFEGAHISAGMRAAPGAIERVCIRGAEVSTYTIGRLPPVGICGSGVLDAVAEMRAVGAIDRRGNFRAEAPGVRARQGQPEFLLVPAAQTGHHRDITITRGDVNEIQLAKAAIRAGIDVLLHEAQCEPAELEEIVVAGAFGSYLDLSSAVRAGLLPGVPLERFRQVGNAAGAGARQMLLSAERRRAAQAIARRVEYVELAAHPAFHRGFVTAMSFEDSTRGALSL
jgi:uncharacterized 2Fe-2S/4Fe-4S cluster protein (DUF4445 family)